MVLTFGKAVTILLNCLFGGNDFVSIAAACLYMAGCWRLLEKSGLKGWWALIPCAREYQLGRCAGREPEGRSASLAAFLHLLLSTLTHIMEGADTGVLLIANSPVKILGYWGHLMWFVLLFAALTVITLEFIDRDKR